MCEGSPRDCSALDDQCNVGVCNEDTDSCVKEPKSDGTDCCSDGKCDGWYDTGETKWANTTEYECKYDQKEQKEQKYRDYYCSGGSCTHVVTETQWVDTGNTQTVNKPDGTVCGHGDWETNPANPCEERREILKCMSGTCNPSGEYEYQNKPDGTNCGYGDWETNPENPCKERREILKCVSGTCSPSGEYDYQDKPDGTNCGYGEWENDPANPCKERREILKCVSGTCSPSGEYDYQDKPDGTICGCTANNTLKRCYEGSCSDTGICNSTVCGADSSCDGKKPGESCDTNKKCNSTCNCVLAPNININITSPENNSIYSSTCIRLNFTVEPEGTTLAWIGYSLDGGANVTIAGNTTVSGLSACGHNIVVYANDSNGNTAAANLTYFILHPGDINGDRVVDVFDLQRLAWAFNSYSTHPDWNENADLNCDNKVNVFDLQLLAWNFGNDYNVIC